MSRRVVISGLGPVSGVGIGIDPTWAAVCAGQSAIDRVHRFDVSGFDCQIAAEVEPFKINQFVPKWYRKATKVMARDIELAVIGADLAARDAKIRTKGTDPESVKDNDFCPSYDPARVGCHIGAGLIAADLDELTGALVESRSDRNDTFDMHKWGREGMQHLTPLWLLKYLPNMLACHVTIIHDTEGPSNTITCGEASSGLSIGESLRVIQRGNADICFCGGMESKLNPITFLRQHLIGRLTTTGNDDPSASVRPFDQQASGGVVGEGGGIVILEAMETVSSRKQQTEAPQAYAEVVGFGASQTVNRDQGVLDPDRSGGGILVAIRSALREAAIGPEAIDLVAPFGSGLPLWDQSEAAALRQLFGSRLGQIPVTSLKAFVGNCGAGAGGLELAIIAKAMAEQTVPQIVNRDNPLEGFAHRSDTTTGTDIQFALIYSCGLGGQNTALVLKKFET